MWWWDSPDIGCRRECIPQLTSIPLPMIRLDSQTLVEATSGSLQVVCSGVRRRIRPIPGVDFDALVRAGTYRVTTIVPKAQDNRK